MKQVAFGEADDGELERMPTEWFSTCKDCGKKFGYSDGSYRLAVERGQSRPERCPDCRRLHSREISTVGLSHYELTPLNPIPSDGLPIGGLGKLDRPARKHTSLPFKSKFDFNKFGIKDDHIRAFFDVLQKHQIVVVVAPTGAGKSTFLPYRLMVPPTPPEDLWTRRGQIIITQPRIQATRNIPDFVASKLHGSSLGAGYDVGFKHSGSPATDRRNKLVYMTDGSLINMIVRNEIGALSVIMIDEAHERSLNIDLILGLLKEQLPKYPHLKLIIASATIDTKKFLTYYGAPEINPDDSFFRFTDDEGNLLYKNNEIAEALKDSPSGFYGFPGKREHPVETRYQPVTQQIRETRFVTSMPEEVANKVFEILLAMTSNEPSELISAEVRGNRIEVKGDILAFLHGERPIKDAVELIAQKVADEPRLSGKVDVLPLYTKLTQNEQDQALKPKNDPKRIRVVISTNVAETSLTVEGIVHVVDSGLINEAQWDPETQTSFVIPKKHSQSGCRQRWGRAGRIQPGIAHCLYSEDQFKAFPEHTLAEIARSPIDQIVLTAKAAGVGDINKFNWIQSPSLQELGRAPAYLQQIGALDADGDLTNHGLELRTYPAEIEYANLMILADRFGCAVEMATLLPMIELGGYTTLLRWDRNWDASTKRAVYAVQRGLIEPCEDDVEFYLKLWDAWEGTRFKRITAESRKQWSDHFFVNHEIFEKDVKKKREIFLDSLAAHKKSDEIRPISLDLLDRVRIVITYGLCNHIYNRTAQENGGEASVRYQAYIANPDRHPELVELHKGATVQISPESILHGRSLPDYFVCGKRQRQRRYVSALAEPEIVISAAFLAKINPNWLKVVEQPFLDVVRLIHQERQRQIEKADSAERLNKLFIDQFYPVGAIYECHRNPNDLLQIERRISTPVKIVTGIKYEEIDDVAPPAAFEAEGELDPKAGTTRKDESIATSPDELVDEIGPIWNYLLDDDEGDHAGQITFVEDRIRPLGVVIADADRMNSDGSIEATVSGYICEPDTNPILKLRPVLHPDPFDTFHKTRDTGKSYDFEIVGVEHYVNDPLSYLIVRDLDSRLEIGMDPFDASLTGRNYAVDYLIDHQGEKINITVEKIQPKGKLVRLSRLAQAEEQMIRFMGKESERTVDARITEVRDNGIHVWFDPNTTIGLLPCGGFSRIQRLPNRPDEMVLGKICKVHVKTKNWKKRAPFQSIKSLSEKVEKSLASKKVGNHINWNPTQSRLSVDGRINYIQRNELLSLSEDPAYQKAIHILYRRSNEFELDVIDITGEILARDEINKKGFIAATIVSVNPNGVVVRTDGSMERFIPYSKAIARKGMDLTKYYLPGQIRLLNVENNTDDGNGLQVDLLRPEDDPVLDFPVGRIFVGFINGFLKEGLAAFVSTQAGMKDAFLPREEYSFERVNNLTDVLYDGALIEVRVIENDILNHKMKVSHWRLVSEQKEIPIERANKISLLKKSKNKIQNETQTSILFNEKNTLIIEGSTIEQINDAIMQIENVIGASLNNLPIINEIIEDEFLSKLSDLSATITEQNLDKNSVPFPNFMAELLNMSEQNTLPASQPIFRQELTVSYEEFEKLTETDNDEFEKLIGINKSIIEVIASQCKVKIQLDSKNQTIVLISDDQKKIDSAISKIEKAIN